MSTLKTVSPTLFDFSEKLVLLFCLATFCAGCSTSYKATLSPALSEHIEPSLTFPQIKESPDSFKGKLVILGGQVLSAKRLKETTQLTILQLPLIDDREPTTELTQSQGRFIAEQQEFLDPATVPSGTRITLVGELSGSVTQSLDETVYTYPTLIMKHFKVWPAYHSDYERYGPYYPYPYGYPYPYAYPYWRPYGRFYPYSPYWYW
ncbi:MAG: Slp family lipoprotein [Nitrospirota bacterium]|nr:Slp family lipoprotein [Nitrospirota bacterium]MDH4360001.1 Slp family lipoprotein [Nitrospirota bacterium]MDH5575585.1 Slp family lipoprotein [Nitrospirota bacterium]